MALSDNEDFQLAGSNTEGELVVQRSNKIKE